MALSPSAAYFLMNPTPKAATGAGSGGNAGSGSGGSNNDGSGGVSGVPSDAQLQQLISGDPIYQQQLVGFGAQSDADAAELAKTINSLLVQYGVTPDLVGAAGELGLSNQSLQGLLGGLDPSTAGLAAMNTQSGTSILGRLMHANDVAQATIKGQLAGRGMLESGDSGFRLGEQSLKYNQGLYDAFNTLMSAIDKGQNTFATDQNKLASDQSTAAQQAFTRQLNMLMQAGGILPASLGGGLIGPNNITGETNSQLPQHLQLPGLAPGAPVIGGPGQVSAPVPFGGNNQGLAGLIPTPKTPGVLPQPITRSGGGAIFARSA